MAVIGEEIRDYVKNQINARQTLHGSGAGHTGISRTGKQINLLNSNTSWIKLASGVSVSEAKLIDIGLDPSLSDTTLAENFVLFSGISRIKTNIVEETNEVTQEITEKFFTQLEQREGFLPRDGNSSYTYGSYGFSPMPGIHSADIKTLTRGSLKKATVKLTANNKQQFDIIDILYMRLGYTVLLEWGNSIYTTTGFDKEILRNTLIEEKFFESYGSNSYLTFLNDIEAKRDKHAGNYDALLGKVSNFSWSFNSDGSYDIELTIISLGDVIESLKSNLSVDKATNKFLNAIKSAQKISDTPPPENPKPELTDAKYTSIENLVDRNIAFAKDIAAYNEAEEAKKEEKKNNPQDEEVIDDENSSADTITALLTIWKYISQDLSAKTTADPSNSQAIQLVTTDSTGQGDFKTIGSLLSPSVDESDFTAGTVNVIFTITYNTLAEEQAASKARQKANEVRAKNRNYVSCFIAGTKITMADGTLKNIEDVIVGDEIKGYKNNNKVFQLDHVLLGKRKLYSFNNDEHYFFTSEHPFMTEEGWKSVKPEKTKKESIKLYNQLKGKLKIGDKLVTENGLIEIINIKSKEMNNTQIPLYNFHVSNDNSYIANNYIVHNKQ